ncbi:hypothetical protein LAUMK42_03666 [Mycobacterium persicum]|uniref:DUF222 domain-containing protein n=1 Tax=Mycobacterium persicum TaxID=1487726 RepID=A0AB38UWE9_9MYCO|nr:hypothetical protein LAUMK42_03666 [Mycobacterium persicum]
MCELSFAVLTTPERLRALERLERAARRLRTPQHALINQLGAQAGETELGGTLRSALADRLRITKVEAGRRIDEAADLGPRRALTGERLAPQLSATAAGRPTRRPDRRRGPPPGAPTSTTSPWPAESTTDSPKKAGAPARTPEAIPNGYRRRTSIADSPAPTLTTTPNDSSATATTNAFDGSILLVRRQITLCRQPR